MSGYRPITDVWILARSKTKYYGAFPAGFLHRARALMGIGPGASVLFVCGGKVREYPYPGSQVKGKLALDRKDKTVDLDAGLFPDFVMDVRKELPQRPADGSGLGLWDAVIIDRPYTEVDASRYEPGAATFPELNDLLKRSLELVPYGGRVGVLDYLWPHPGKRGLEVAVVAVGTGRNARARWFTVFERVKVE